MKKYLFIFDMGNVVVDSCSIFKDIINALGFKNITEEQKDDMRNIFEATTRGNITSMEMLRIVAERNGLPEPTENYSRKFFKPRMIPETVELISKIKKAGFRVVCGTNTIDVHYAYHMEHKEYDIFDKVYASQIMRQMKPDVTFWMAIKNAEKDYDYNEMFFFDDMEENVKAAASLGINAHLFTDADDAAEYIRKVAGIEL